MPSAASSRHTPRPARMLPEEVSTEAFKRRSSARHAHSRKTALRTSLAPDAAASTATRPNVRDDGQRPSSRDGMAGVVRVIWGPREAEYFCNRGWTGQITLKLQQKIARARMSNRFRGTQRSRFRSEFRQRAAAKFICRRPKWISSVSGGNLFRPVLSCSPVTPAQLLTAEV